MSNTVTHLKFEQTPPIESNVGLNDCGVLSAYACAIHFGTIREYPANIDEMRLEIGKNAENGTQPGAIIRFLKENGLNVQYYSGVHWDRIAGLTDVEMADFCEKMNKSTDDPDLAEMMEPDAVRNSAMYILENNVANAWGQKDPLTVFDHALKEGALIILLIRASHYVVVTGQDEETFMVCDPNHSISSVKAITRENLLDQWALQNGSVLPDNQILNLQEAIIVSKN